MPKTSIKLNLNSLLFKFLTYTLLFHFAIQACGDYPTSRLRSIVLSSSISWVVTIVEIVYEPCITTMWGKTGISELIKNRK